MIENAVVKVDHVVKIYKMYDDPKDRFKEALGKGIAQLIRETMLNHVRRVVQETDIPFQKLAADAGIATSAHLSVLFRRHFGTTMSAVRHSHAVPSHCATRSPERARLASA